MVGKEEVKGNTLEAHHNLERGQRRGPGSYGQRVSRGVKKETSVILSSGLSRKIQKSELLTKDWLC